MKFRDEPGVEYFIERMGEIHYDCADMLAFLQSLSPVFYKL